MGALKMREVGVITLDTGTSSQTTELDAIDLSGAHYLKLDLKLTKADTGAGDLLNIHFQETSDRVTWNDRMRSPDFAGTLSPSATAPETWQQTLSAIQTLTAAEASYEPTGSAGATALSKDKVHHGPLLPPVRSSSGLQSAHRVFFEVTSATAADYEGTLRVLAWFPV